MSSSTTRVENLSCPECGSPERRRNGMIDEVQRWTCKDCGRSYLATYRQPPVLEEIRVVAGRLLALGTAPMVVASALQMSSQWVYELRRLLG